jgi:FixJ family two-component response regulator
MRLSLSLLLESVGLTARTYASVDSFLEAFDSLNGTPACLLLDVRMPGTSGMTLLEQLHENGARLPTILITGHGDIDMAVRAMKLGAVDFITKPFNGQRLLDLVQDVLRDWENSPPFVTDAKEAQSRLDSLTQREREVFDLLVEGGSNKAVASDLGISIRTVESHRAHIMEKLGARTVVDLVHLAFSSRSTP